MNQHIRASLHKSSTPPPDNEQPKTSAPLSIKVEDKEKPVMSFRIDDILVKSRGDYDTDTSEELIKVQKQHQQESFLNRKLGCGNPLMASLSSLYKYFTPMMMNKGLTPDIMSLMYNGRSISVSMSN